MLSKWIYYYIGDLVFWLWIFKWGGAELIGDTFISGFFTFMISLKWHEMSPEGLKLFGWLIITVHTILFIIGLTTPEFIAFFVKP
jgi:hypothetical protein